MAQTHTLKIPTCGHPGDRLPPSRRHTLTRAALWLALALFWCAATAAETRIEASLSASVVAAGQPVELTLRVEGSPTASPDLSVLDAEFRIVDRRLERRTRTVNGDRSEQVTLRLTLLPLHGGNLRIPAIALDGGRSEPLELTVLTPADSAPNETSAIPAPRPPSAGLPRDEPAPEPVVPSRPAPRLELEASPEEVRVGQQILLIARVRGSASQLAARLLEPEVADARLLPLGETSYPEPDGPAGSMVYERRYALFPERPGRLEIPSLRLVPDAESGGEVRSEALSVDVQPIAAELRPGEWLPAESVVLSEPGPETYRVPPGQALERLIVIRARGLPGAALPALPIDLPYELQQRAAQPRTADQVGPDGVVGTRVERRLLTAHEPGVYRLPAVDLRWWNTRSGRAETARLPARNLEVVALVEPASEAPRGAAPAASTPPRDTPAGTAPAPAAASSGGPWPWVSLGLAVALAAMFAAYRRRTHAPAELPVASPEPQREIDPMDAAITAVRAAYEGADAIAARTALLDWAQWRWPDDPPRNLARLTLRCPEPLRRRIARLETAFFSPEPVAWEHEPVWEDLERLSREDAERRTAPAADA